jgi:alginate O-acetyltransferase complex protein AlgI
MVFSSILFIFYFLPIFFLFYYLVGKRYKNLVILAGSVLFYAWGAPRFVFVLLATTILDFFLVKLMDRQTGSLPRKLMLCCSLCLNLGLLFYFKYSNFFVENINRLLHMSGSTGITWTKLVLPIGISFYTFETITYVVDVYRRQHKPLANFLDYQMYIILFPKLIAGPIIRFHDFAGQIHDHIGFETIDNMIRGLCRFSIGLAKKVLIANVMGANADTIFGLNVHRLDTATAWLGIVSYTFQIYFDFSGYSDMAIGLGQMMGFRFPENFNNPYTASSITDFWRRWHMTLGTWMRNYLYIPMGGNQVSRQRLYFNLWFVFLASGLWHGAAWTFVVWGAYHGFFLVVERIFLGRWLHRMGTMAFLYTFPVVAIGWVFFRSNDLSFALSYLSRMFTWQPYVGHVWHGGKQFITIMFVAALFSFFTLPAWGRRIQQKVYYDTWSPGMYYTMVCTGIVLCILSAGSIATSTFNPFIYFRF